MREQIRNVGGDPVFSFPEEFEQNVARESKQLDQILDKYWDKKYWDKK